MDVSFVYFLSEKRVFLRYHYLRPVVSYCSESLLNPITAPDAFSVTSHCHQFLFLLCEYDGAPVTVTVVTDT